MYQTFPTLLPTPTIATARLLLRPPTEADAECYQKHFADYEVIRNLHSVVPWPYPDDGALQYLREIVLPVQGKDRWIWAITEKERPAEVIGSIDLWREGRPENRGFWLGRAFWGRGYMTEVASAVMDFAFGPAGFEKLIFSNAVGNSRSGRVKEKTGARLLRTEPASYVDPQFTAREVWELTKEEWNLAKGKSVSND